MPRFGHAQVIGFAADVCEVCAKVRTSLKQAGVDADVQIERVETLRDKTLALNAQQEAEKRQLVATTAAYEESIQDLYIVASGVLDTAMASVKKTSPDGKNIQRIRSRVRRAPTATALAVAPLAPAQGKQ